MVLRTRLVRLPDITLYISLWRLASGHIVLYCCIIVLLVVISMFAALRWRWSYTTSELRTKISQIRQGLLAALIISPLQQWQWWSKVERHPVMWRLRWHLSLCSQEEEEEEEEVCYVLWLQVSSSANVPGLMAWMTWPSRDRSLSSDWLGVSVRYSGRQGRTLMELRKLNFRPKHFPKMHQI